MATKSQTKATTRGKKTSKSTGRKTGVSTRTAGKSLVIVESPAKARTIGQMLGNKYEVVASQGHVRDLPKGKIGVDVDNEFQPSYVIMRDKRAIFNDLKKAGDQASNIYLATARIEKARPFPGISRWRPNGTSGPIHPSG